MTEENANPEVIESTDTAAEVASMVESNEFDFVLDKYRAEGRTDQESAYEQAKAYTELQKQFGGFTGAPEAYELALSEELKEQGVELDTDDPIFEKASEMAKELNMSNEAFNDMMSIYAMAEMAKENAVKESMEAELKLLGDNATNRLQNIDKWAQANLSADMIEGFSQMATSAKAVEALEKLISMTRSAPINPQETQPRAGLDPSEIKDMQFALDENGNRKMATDPEYRKKVQALMTEAFPGDSRTQVG